MARSVHAGNDFLRLRGRIGGGHMGRLSKIAVLLGATVVIAGCGGNQPTPAGTSGEQKGVFGVSYYVSVSRPVGGTITSADGRIDCGTAGGTKNLCEPVSFAWGATASFTATADTGQFFQSWAGDCSGAVASGVGGCSLNTLTYGSDKWVVAVFNPPDQLGHSRIPDPAQHSPLFFDFIKSKATPNPGAPKCTNCHGANYTGLANAPSCTACHAAAGHGNWLTDCGFCHGAPPPPPHSTSTGCNGCHPGTVNSDGTIVAGGLHMDGQVQGSGGGGHAAGFANPAVHGPQYLGHLGGVPNSPDCTGCHGPTMATCTNCHSSVAGGSWVNWQSNCTFCHGTATKTYTLANLAMAAPPSAVVAYAPPPAFPESQRTGKHAAHATSACTTCHVVPTNLSHIGATGRATVTLVGYSAATSTCTVSCHGATTQSWDTAAPSLSCTSCHDQPPLTGKNSSKWVNSGPTMHDGHVNDAPEWTAYVGNVAGMWDSGYAAELVCVDCHANSVNPDGTIRAFGTHTNGIQGDVAFGGGLGGSATVTPSQVTCAMACHGSRTWY